MQMWREGRLLTDIAAKLGRSSADSIQMRVAALRERGCAELAYRKGITAAKKRCDLRAKRKCLGCRRTFTSKHVGHRLCEACARLARQDLPVEIGRVGW